jgi:hypothetical protein
MSFPGQQFLAAEPSLRDPSYLCLARNLIRGAALFLHAVRCLCFAATILACLALQARADSIYCTVSVTANKTNVCVGETVNISVDKTTCTNDITFGSGTNYPTSYGTAGVYTVSASCSACAGTIEVGGSSSLNIYVGQLNGISPSSATICPGNYMVFTAASVSNNIPCGPGWSFSPTNAGTLSYVGNTATFTLSPSYTNSTATISAGCGTNTNTATIAIGSGFTINTQPVSVVTCPGSITTFTVAATGTSLSYQWLWNGMILTNGYYVLLTNSPSVVLTNGGHIYGATNSTLTISNVFATSSASNSIPADDGAGTSFTVNRWDLYTYQATGCVTVHGLYMADPDGNTYTNGNCTPSAFFAGPAPADAGCDCPGLLQYSLINREDCAAQLGISGQFQQAGNEGLALALNDNSRVNDSGSWEATVTHTLEGVYSCIVSSSCGTLVSTTATLYVSTPCDGIPDWWRLEYFGSTTTNTNSCASCDLEHDGFTNLQKFQDGLNPLVAYVLTAPAQVIASSTGNTASVTSFGTAATYDWAITDGTLTTGQSTTNITWTAGSAGVCDICVTVSVNQVSITLCTNVTVTDGLIPAGTTPNWVGNVGVLGDIPNRTTIYTNVSPSGDTSGATDYNNITRALGSCPPNEVVTLTNGGHAIYYSNGYITVPSLVTLRGSGISNSGSAWTIVRCVTNVNGWYSVVGIDGGGALSGENPSVDSSAVGITVGLSQGSTNITTSSPHGLSVGQIVLIDQTNSTANYPPVTEGVEGPNDVRPYSGGTQNIRGMGQLDKVVAVPNATNLTLEIPLYYNYDATRQPQVTYVGTVTTNAGVEDMTLDNTAALQGSVALFSSAANSWLLNVDCYGSYTYSIRFNVGYRCTVRSCKAHVTAAPFAPGDGYGIISFPYASACLVENCQSYALNAAIIVDGVTSGNVFGYNTLFMLQDNSDRENGTIVFHGSYPFMNLFEGNWFDGELLGDDYHGTGGFNTFYCNRHFINTSNGTNAITLYAYDVDLWENYRGYNFVGNIFGTNGFEYEYQTYCGHITNQQPISVYNLGFSNLVEWGSVNACAPGDLGVRSNTFIHLNYDTVTGGITTSNGFSQTLSNSLYLAAQPSWWTNLPWGQVPFNPNNAASVMGPAAYTNIQSGYNYAHGN